MRKKILGSTLAAALAAALAISGCSQKTDILSKKAETTEQSAKEETTEETTEEVTEEETLSPEQMDLAKFNYYVELNNKIVEMLDVIDYYYEVVDYKEEFALIPDSGLTYGYRIAGFNSDIIDDCLELSELEPTYETLDPLVKEIAEPTRTLMDAFSDLSRSNDFADNQYQKAKELHAVIYPAAEKFEALAHQYLDAVNQEAGQRTLLEEEQLKSDGRLIAYNASRGITIAGQILDECIAQDVTDDTINELDLTNIKPLYEELVVVVNDLNAATGDSEQMVKESMSNSRPFDQLYERMLQALEWMIKQVESGKPIEDPHLEPLGSLAHFSNTLSDCIDRYNSIFVD